MIKSENVQPLTGYGWIIAFMMLFWQR